jgi:hypothetical protein
MNYTNAHGNSSFIMADAIRIPHVLLFLAIFWSDYTSDDGMLVFLMFYLPQMWKPLPTLKAL